MLGYLGMHEATLGDLARSVPYWELKMLRGCGKRTQAEIEDAVERAGINWQEEYQPAQRAEPERSIDERLDAIEKKLDVILDKLSQPIYVAAV